MPSKNSPTNKIGKTATTMNNEYIVIMQKQWKRITNHSTWPLTRQVSSSVRLKTNIK
jgi:hypothetical protein